MQPSLSLCIKKHGVLHKEARMSPRKNTAYVKETDSETDDRDEERHAEKEKEGKKQREVCSRHTERFP